MNRRNLIKLTGFAAASAALPALSAAPEAAPEAAAVPTAGFPFFLRENLQIITEKSGKHIRAWATTSRPGGARILIVDDLTWNLIQPQPGKSTNGLAGKLFAKLTERFQVYDAEGKPTLGYNQRIDCLVSRLLYLERERDESILFREPNEQWRKEVEEWLHCPGDLEKRKGMSIFGIERTAYLPPERVFYIWARDEWSHMVPYRLGVTGQLDYADYERLVSNIHALGHTPVMLMIAFDSCTVRDGVYEIELEQRDGRLGWTPAPNMEGRYNYTAEELRPRIRHLLKCADIIPVYEIGNPHISWLSRSQLAIPTA